MQARPFIFQNLQLLPAPSVPEIRLYAAHSGSGLHRLLGRDNDVPPYWAYHWAGGTVLARYILDHPQAISGKRVMDLGTGSGIVAITAAKCGASSVIGVDVDPLAVIAAELNAEANGVVMSAVCRNILDEPPPDVDLLLVGDLFYDTLLAGKVLPFLKRCRGAGIDVLVGDPGRDPLPRAELELIRQYSVADFGDARESRGRISGVYTLPAP